MVFKSFKACCISNALDGKEDNIVWDWHLLDQQEEDQNNIDIPEHTDWQSEMNTDQDMELLDAHDIADDDESDDE